MSEVITPSAPAAPSSPSAPAPAAPASSTPTPQSTPTPAAPSTPVSNPSGELSIQDKLRSGWNEAKAAVPLEEGNGSAAPAEVPAAEVPAAEAPAQTAEEIAEAAAVAGDTPAEGETPAGEQPAAAAAAAEVPDLDDGTAFGPLDFAKALTPEAKKFFDDNPEIKGKVFSALREREETREIRQIVPDVETAKAMSQGAATWSKNDNLFLGATTKEGVSKFLDNWTQMAMYVDEQGQPVIENGQYKFHPALTNTFNHILENRLSVLRANAESTQNERLLAALDILAEVNAPSSPALGEVPEELKLFADSLTQREKALTEKEKTDQQADQSRRTATNTESIERAEQKAEDSIVAQLQPRFKTAGLTAFEQNAAMVKIGQLVDQKLAELPYYQAALDSILGRAPGEAREKEHQAHLLKYTNQILGPIVAQVIREAKGGTLARQETRQETRTTQTAASNSDPKTRSTTPAQPADVTDPNALIALIRTEWATAHPGEEMPREHLIKEQMKRSGAFAARS